MPNTISSLISSEPLLRFDDSILTQMLLQNLVTCRNQIRMALTYPGSRPHRHVISCYPGLIDPNSVHATTYGARHRQEEPAPCYGCARMTGDAVDQLHPTARGSDQNEITDLSTLFVIIYLPFSHDVAWSSKCQIHCRSITQLCG